MHLIYSFTFLVNPCPELNAISRLSYMSVVMWMIIIFSLFDISLYETQKLIGLP